MLLLLWRLHPHFAELDVEFNTRVRAFSPRVGTLLEERAPRAMRDVRATLTPVPARAMTDRRGTMDDLVPRPMRR